MDQFLKVVLLLDELLDKIDRLPDLIDLPQVHQMAELRLRQYLFRQLLLLLVVIADQHELLLQRDVLFLLLLIAVGDDHGLPFGEGFPLTFALAVEGGFHLGLLDR